MADRKSGSSEDEVKEAARPLEEQDIKVIPVVVGEEADPRELGNTTPDKKNMIEADKQDDAREVGEKIMDKIRGNSLLGKQILSSFWIKRLYCHTNNHLKE